MSENWCVRVADRVYGPYPIDRMRSFVDEGRLAPNSMVAPEGERRFIRAGSAPALRPLFVAPGESKRAFGVRDADEPSRSSEPSTSIFLLVFDTVSGAAGRLEKFVRALGPAQRVADNTWAVAAQGTAAGARNAIAPHLNTRETLLVVDASRGRSAWVNYCPETDAKMKRLWREAR